jgi:serine/threonine protein kinase
MANPVSTVPEYVALLSRSKLLPPEEVAELQRKWPGPDADLENFRKHLVAGRHLTEYQSVMLQRGHADGFFVGGYVILDRIGKGQSAGVYKAVHRSGQVVALKVLAGSKAKNPHVLSRFQREGRLLTQLNHPNVVKAFQLGQAGDVHYIAMEHLEGETLEDVLDRRKKLPWAEATRVVSQMLTGLEHLHGKKMVHRDAKPANMMVIRPQGGGKTDTTLDSTIKIVDIGLGREMFDEDDAQTRDIALTQEGALLGTPDYPAPEQARDARNADIRADVYAAGCVLYHCLTGRPPFSERNLMAQMVKHATTKPEPILKLTPDVPPGLQAVVDRMLQKDPADRYQTPGEAATALEPFLPADNAGPEDSQLLPAYKEWLETESEMEMPLEVKAILQKTAPKPSKPGTSPAVTLPPKKDKEKDSDDPEIDVELITLPPPVVVKDTEDANEPLSPLPQTRRDWMLFGAGCGVALLAVGLGFGLAQLAKKKPQPNPAE